MEKLEKFQINGINKKRIVKILLICSILTISLIFSIISLNSVNKQQQQQQQQQPNFHVVQPEKIIYTLNELIKDTNILKFFIKWDNARVEIEKINKLAIEKSNQNLKKQTNI